MELETTSLTLVLALDYLLQILAFFQTTGGASAEIPKHEVSTRQESTSVEGTKYFNVPTLFSLVLKN